jgi:hypothetical protein
LAAGRQIDDEPRRRDPAQQRDNLGEITPQRLTRFRAQIDGIPGPEGKV